VDVTMQFAPKTQQEKHNEQGREWRKNHPEEYKQYRHNYYIKNRIKINIQMQALRQGLKLECLSHYGGNPPKCSCCGEAKIQFLTLDHIDGDGNKHRKGLRSAGYVFYFWLRKHGFPEGLQVLCFNCNCGRQLNKGICPHKEMN